MKISHYYQRLSHALFITASLSVAPAFADYSQTSKIQPTTYDSYATVKYQSEYQSVYSKAELAQLLAPIALYPDVILSHTLIASTYLDEVDEACRWLKHYDHLSAYQLKQKVKSKYWDESVKALIQFPQILNQLSYDKKWSKQLASAFLTDEEHVLTSIQFLRKKADTAGSLSQLGYLRVERHHDIIVIALPSSNHARIPYYNTRKVYGNWHWANHQPVNFHKPRYFSRHQGPFYWSQATYIGGVAFFSDFNWLHHQVVIYRDSRSFHNRRYSNQRKNHNYSHHWNKNRANKHAYKRKLKQNYNRGSQVNRNSQQRRSYQGNNTYYDKKQISNRPYKRKSQKQITHKQQVKKSPAQLVVKHIKKSTHKNVKSKAVQYRVNKQSNNKAKRKQIKTQNKNTHIKRFNKDRA